MNWKELKEFCNSLDEKQLEKEVIIWTEETAMGDLQASEVEENIYFDPEDSESTYYEKDAPVPVENLQIAYHKGDPILFENIGK